MATLTTIDALTSLTTFGRLLHYLRRQARLTQLELSIAVGYSESMISRLEHDLRAPDAATILALFVPTLHLADQPDVVAQLVRLAAESRLKETGQGTAANHQAGTQGRQTEPTMHRLPVRLTSFVGREDDVLAVAKLLARSRLVTLTGPGGCGKTSLAVETCRWLIDSDTQARQANGVAWMETTDAVAFVELYPLSDPSLIVQAVLAALGVEGNREQDSLQLLLNTIDERYVLIVLDNCEHFVDDAARFAQAILRRCPNLRILATSRERLNIAPESIYAVAPLAYPQERPLPGFADIADSPAVRLFVERSQAVMPAMQLTPQNAVPIAQICRLLDGVPLALELGAATTATFSLHEIIERLSKGKLLTSPGYRDAEPRHRSINDTIAWSYNLLAPTEQQLLAELAVFAGGWTLAALQEVCTGTRECVPTLHQLVQKSLVSVEHAVSGADATRYNLLRAVREYAAERLRRTGGEEHIRRKHFGYFAQLGIALGEKVLGVQHAAAMAGLDADYPNLCAALAFAAGNADLAEQRAQLAGALPFYWRRRGYVSEGLGWLRPILDDEGLLSLPTRALVYAAVLLLRFDAPTKGYQYLHVDRDGSWMLARADALIEPCLGQGEEGAAALLMITVASLQHYPGSEVKAVAYARRSWVIFEHSGDVRGAALACNLLTRILIDQGDVEAAQRVHSGAVHSFEQHGMTWALCEAYRLDAHIAEIKNDRAAMIRNQIRLAEVSEQEQFAPFLHNAFGELEREEPALASRMAEELLERQRKLGPSVMLGVALHQLGRMCVNSGRYKEAARFLDEALELWTRLGEVQGVGIGTHWSLLDRGQAAQFMGDKVLAIACFSESIRLFATEPFHKYPLLARGQARFESTDLVGAMEDYRTCLCQAVGDPDGWRHFIVYCLAGIGEVAYLRSDIVSAAKLWAACAAFYSKWKTVETFGQPHQAIQFQRVMAAAPQRGEDPVFAAAWKEGKVLTFEEMVSLALAIQWDLYGTFTRTSGLRDFWRDAALSAPPDPADAARAGDRGRVQREHDQPAGAWRSTAGCTGVASLSWRSGLPRWRRLTARVAAGQPLKCC